MGKVPVVEVNGKDVLFESAVINEFVSEVNPPLMHPADPVDKARNRAWIEFGSGLLGIAFRMANASDQETFESLSAELGDKLARVENEIGDGPYFNGATFSLIDSSYAPLFMRLQIADEILPEGHGLFADLPKIAKWSESLLALPEVQDSVVPEFYDVYKAGIAKRDGYLAQYL